MAIKATLDRAGYEALPEAQRSLYAERGGQYVVDLEGTPSGFVSRETHDSFRQNNIALERERDALRQKYGDLDPEAARKALEEQQKLREKKLLDEGAVEQLFSERSKRMKDDYEAKIAAAEKSRTDTETHLQKLLVDRELMLAGSALGIKDAPAGVDPLTEGPMVDFVNRGRSVFAIKDGQAVAIKDGAVVYGKEGKPLTIREWAEEQASRGAAHLFKQSRGGGASPKDPVGNSVIGGKRRSEMTRDEEDRFIGEHGYAALAKLPK